MNDFALSSQLCWQITLTLLHVSWIGILIGFAAAAGNRVLKSRSASVRYWLHSLSLIAFASSLPLTFAVVRSMSVDDGYDVGHSPVSVATNAVTPPMMPQHEDASAPTAPADAMVLAPDKPSASFQPDRSVRSDRSDQSIGSDRSGPGPSAVWEKCQHIAKAAAPFVAALYFIGVLLMLIKLAIGVRVSRSLRAAGQPIADANLASRMATQAKKLSLRVVPVIAYCEHVAVPIVIGLLRPMILVPAATVNGLTTEQLESVLTHELAHLRRYDHLLIVLQRVLEAVLFFHPVTWYLSRSIHDERETCCDDLVLAIGGDRLHYARSLLRVAELCLAAAPRNGKSLTALTALAADGQRPSKLRQRISRLLGDSSNDSVRVSSIWPVAVLVAFVATSGWVINALAAPAVVETQDEVTPDFESIKNLVEQAHTGPREIKTAHVRFRIARPGSGFQKDLTPEKCAELLESHDLVSKPDHLRSLLNAFVRNDEQLAEEPWSNVDLYLEGSKTRTTKSSSNHGPDYWVRDGNTTLRWDAANLQADLLRTTDDWIHEETLDFFLRLNYIVAKQITQRKPTEIARDGDLLLLRYKSDVLTEETQISLLNGCVHSHTRSVNGAIISEQLQLGWRRYNNIWLPSVVAELQYRRNQLDGCKVIVIEQASINSSLPAGIFTLGASAGSVIVDKRDGLTQTYTINHDVYDLTSNEQLQAAMQPLSKELTPDESGEIATAIDSAKQQKDEVEPLVAAIDKDHSLEFVAVVSMSDRTKAWAPDGTPIEPQPTWPKPTMVRSQEMPTHGFIFQCPGLQDGTAIAWRGPGPVVTPSLSESVPEWIGLSGTFTDLQTVNVRAGLTTPAWGPWVSIAFDDSVMSYETSPEFSELYARIKPDAYQNSNQYGLVLKGVNGVDERAQHEVVAVLKDGSRKNRSGTGPTNDNDLITFFEGTDLIDHLEYRLRPYVHWVTFENVSLALGVKSDAKVAVETLELPEKAAQKIRGHVRDASGKPIAGANVAIRTTTVGIPKVMQAKTDSDGLFEIPFSGDSWPKHIPLVLWVWAPDYAVNVETQFASKDDLATPVNITLAVPDKVRFRVTAPGGNGVAGADVTPSEIAIQMPNAYMMTDLIDTVPEFLRRTSDADGIVELDSFQSASLRSLTIHSDDYGIQRFNVNRVSMSLIDPNGVMSLTLQPTARVRGRLVGAPEEFLKGIQVDLRTDVRSQITGAVAGFGAAITDDEGRFEVAALASGELSVTQHDASDAEWRLVPNKHTLISGTSPEIEFVLNETVEMPFRIIREDSGSPVAGVGVIITDESDFHEVATGTSDERGEFRARVFENSWHVARVSRMPTEFTLPTDEHDFAWFPESPVRFQSAVAADGFKVPVVPIAVPKGQMLRGQLVDPDNKPLAHWTVITRGSGGETDADGKFRIMLRHNEVPYDWKTHSPENLPGVPRVISESPLVLQIIDFSKAVLPSQPDSY